MSSISITSADVPLSNLIPVIHKSAFGCSEPNLSPQLSWSYDGGLFEGHIDTIELHVIDQDASGTGYGGNFAHWKVTNIAPAVVSVGQNITWGGAEVIHSTDWVSGDDTNGWNGPCAPSIAGHTYSVYIVANIKPASVGFVGSETVVGSYVFLDNSDNVTPEPGTGSCGQLGCPPGQELVGGQCQLISNANYTVSTTQYTTSPGSKNQAYGAFGMRIYEAVNGFTFPLSGDGSGFLVDDGGGGVPVTLRAASPVSNALWDSEGSSAKGRLNIAGIWTGSGSGLPHNEWIGFSRCIVAPSTKVYCFGFAADNRMRLRLNGELIVEYDTGANANFNYWHVIPIILNEGVNIIEMEGSNDGSDAAFGAEIYDTTPAVLEGLSTTAGLEPYILFSTKDGTGENFDIGENSGFTCPDGYAYDSCTSGQCSSIEYSEPAPLPCAILLENCKDSNDTYLIELDPAETTPFYGDNVYALAGDNDFLEKCFINHGQVVGTPIITNVTIINDYGPNNCVACDPSEKMESCESPGTFTYVALKTGQIAMTVGNIYELDALEGCHSYVGNVTDRGPDNIEVTVTVDHDTNNCLVCEPCLQFRNCASGTDIFIRLADGETEPQPLEVVNLAGDPTIEDNCWQFVQSTETGCTEDYIDVIVVSSTDCFTCDACTSRYLLTDCEDPENTVIIEWNQALEPLNESLIYVFDSEPDICYKVEFLPPESCTESTPTLKDPA